MVHKPFVGVVMTLACVAGMLAIGCSGGGGTNPVAQSISANNQNPVVPASRPATGPRVWQVAAGGNRRHQALQGLDFFSGTITIDVGDSVTWTNGGNAHTITFLGPLSSFPPGDNPNLPFGGNTYDGSALTSSGATIPGNTYTLTFTKAGTYAYMCLFHPPEMTGVVIVQPKGTPYPHPQGFYTGQGLAELNGQLADAQSSLAELPFAQGGTTLAAGIAPGLSGGAPSNSTVLRFLDAPRLGPNNASTIVTVPVGTTLTWVNQTNNEPHTVTFPVAGQPPPNIDPFSPPSGGPNYDGTTLVNSGPFFPGQKYSLTFTGAGTFKYYCLFHDDFGMWGIVIVV
jgi:plastocyanin